MIDNCSLIFARASMAGRQQRTFDEERSNKFVKFENRAEVRLAMWAATGQKLRTFPGGFRKSHSDRMWWQSSLSLYAVSAGSHGSFGRFL